MNNFPTQEVIIDSILKGITEAKNNFLFWTSDRLPLSYGPHKIVTIHVAQEIAKIKEAPEIFIDATISDILRCSLPKRDQFIDFMDKRKLKEGTFGITLDERFKHQNDNDSVSKVIISVVNNVINTKIEYLNEIERICKIINTDKNFEHTTLEYGVFAFYSDLSENARKKLDKRIPEIIKSFDKVVAKYEGLKATFKGGEIKEIEDNGQWSMGCYIIEPFFK